MKFLVLTIDQDITSSYLIKWLIYYSIPFVRINLNNTIYSINVLIDSGNEVVISLNNKRIKVSDFSHIIYRRGYFTFRKNSLKQYIKQIDNILNDEQRILSEFLFHILEEKRIFGSYFKERYHNKLLVLKKASEIGLQIPKTIITTSKNNIKNEIKNIDLITKPIYNNFILLYSNRISSSFTEVVKNEDFNICSDYFFPSKFQNKIEKEYDIRCFIYHKKLFSTAIITSDSKCSIDYRTYQSNLRYVPYKLPDLIVNKLFKLMKNLNLETGSVDLIKGINGLYYFIALKSKR